MCSFKHFGRGTTSQAARDYIGSNRRNITEIQQELTYFNITGDLYELPNGASIGFAAGYEGRVESADYIAGTMQELGLGFSAARKTVGGTYEIDALYYEVKVPLVTRNMDIPFVEGLHLTSPEEQLKTHLLVITMLKHYPLHGL